MSTIKVPHKIIEEEYSDYDLGCVMSPYEKKYNITVVVNMKNNPAIAHVNYSHAKERISALRRLVKLKHTIINTPKPLAPNNDLQGELY